MKFPFKKKEFWRVILGIKKRDAMKCISFLLADRTRLELATPCVTGMYSNQTELPIRLFFQRRKNTLFFNYMIFLRIFFLFYILLITNILQQSVDFYHLCFILKQAKKRSIFHLIHQIRLFHPLPFTFYFHQLHPMYPFYLFNHSSESPS